VSDESAAFPVFNRQPPAQSAEEIEDPVHIAERDPDELARLVADERPGPLPPLRPGAAYVLTPGEDVEEVGVGSHAHGPRIVGSSSSTEA
jgi:hypothetical protein